MQIHMLHVINRNVSYGHSFLKLYIATASHFGNNLLGDYVFISYFLIHLVSSKRNKQSLVQYNMDF